MTFEICTESYVGAFQAAQHGADRIELCAALSVGGLTPSLALAAKCTEIKNLDIHVMIRNSEGDFVYSDFDIELMQKDIASFAEIGVTGVVFGCLTNLNSINLQQCINLTETAKSHNLNCTFHRAFDLVENPLNELKTLINIGVDRVLTSGGQSTAIDGINQIKSLVKAAKGEIEIMAGSGVNKVNALTLSKTGIAALHFTSHSSTAYQLGMGFNFKPNAEKIKSIIDLFK